MKNAPNLYNTLTHIFGQHQHWLNKRYIQFGERPLSWCKTYYRRLRLEIGRVSNLQSLISVTCVIKFPFLIVPAKADTRCTLES